MEYTLKGGKRKNVRKLFRILVVVVIAVVAVTVTSATVAWMNSLTIDPPLTKDLTVTDMVFTEGNATEGKIVVTVSNTGTSALTVDTIKVNDVTVTTWTTSTSATVVSGSTETFTITCEITTGNEYFVRMFAFDGTLIAAYEDTS